eukprot:s1583_g1.t1
MGIRIIRIIRTAQKLQLRQNWSNGQDGFAARQRRAMQKAGRVNTLLRHVKALDSTPDLEDLAQRAWPDTSGCGTTCGCSLPAYHQCTSRAQDLIKRISLNNY